MKRIIGTYNLRPTSVHKLCVDVLKKEKRPMTVKEITKKVSAKQNIGGKTPRYTISSTLQRSAFIKRVERGLYKYSDK